MICWESSLPDPLCPASDTQARGTTHVWGCHYVTSHNKVSPPVVSKTYRLPPTGTIFSFPDVINLPDEGKPSVSKDPFPKDLSPVPFSDQNDEES